MTMYMAIMQISDPFSRSTVEDSSQRVFSCIGVLDNEIDNIHLVQDKTLGAIGLLYRRIITECELREDGGDFGVVENN